MHFDKPASAKEIKDAFEGQDQNAKVQALQKAIMMLLNGESIPALFMTILQHVIPSQDHTMQKLLLLYLVSAERVTRLHDTAGRDPLHGSPGTWQQSGPAVSCEGARLKHGESTAVP